MIDRIERVTGWLLTGLGATLLMASILVVPQNAFADSGACSSCNPVIEPNSSACLTCAAETCESGCGGDPTCESQCCNNCNGDPTCLAVCSLAPGCKDAATCDNGCGTRDVTKCATLMDSNICNQTSNVTDCQLCGCVVDTGTMDSCICKK